MTATAMRTHRCGSLRVGDVGTQVFLCGWVHRRRNLGGLVFLDLRDRDGIVQVSLDPDRTPRSVLDLAADISGETVVRVGGKVEPRPADARNPEMETGDIEVHASSIEILARPEALPIPVWRTKGEDPPSDELRLLHRPLDLRRESLQGNLALRHRLLQRARASLSAMEFFEIETPILTKPTPEGARDYLVPSRVHRGQFYALPQSPQIYKQLLMVSGFDRYFQLARCFRDEDLRADRQPEFTQIDIEASFVSQDDVFGVLENLMVDLWDEAGHCDGVPAHGHVHAPFRRMSYEEAIAAYGSDKPDLRFGLEIEDVGDRFAGRGFQAFDSAMGDGGVVRGISIPGGAKLSRKHVDQLTAVVKSFGLGGLATLKHADGNLSGPLSKLDGVTADSVGLAEGDLLTAAAGDQRVVSTALGAVRTEIIKRLELTPRTDHEFVWIVDFPLFEHENGEWTFAHHPFTAPHADDIGALTDGEFEGVRAQHYDLVYNGTELGSGSIRITDAELQIKVLELLGVSRDEAERRFGFLLAALRLGAPPHGGFAVGFDRVVMLLAGADNLRDVIAFPKTTAARALFEDAPTEVAASELDQLGIAMKEKS